MLLHPMHERLAAGSFGETNLVHHLAADVPKLHKMSETACPFLRDGQCRMPRRKVDVE